MKISEYVSVGHPDKVADYISEYILDRLLEKDPNVRYAVEVQIKDNYVTLGGEITTSAELAEPCWYDWTTEALAEIGYTQEYCDKWGSENTIDPSQLQVVAHISKQSPDIAQGVNNDGWGDQGIFWGMACNDNPSLLPDDYKYAKDLCWALYVSARCGNAPWGLDIKTQVVMNGNEIKKVIVAAPCKPENKKYLEKAIQDYFDQYAPTQPNETIVNGTGAYIKHASVGDCGTTGRKLAVDFYGGNCRIGGGSPWTKDPTKADLTLNLYARILAKEYLRTDPSVNAVYVSIGCCIGRPEIDVTAYDEHNNVLISKTLVKTPAELIQKYELNKPIYARLCMYGLWS
ncbi:MAG: methionine adenosyltransferase domain-containing protein [Bacteroidales bacterium]|nr:methionine adenosyltransferase domain-containing protein [Bacteroidales bacterium]